MKRHFEFFKAIPLALNIPELGNLGHTSSLDPQESSPSDTIAPKTGYNTKSRFQVGSF